MTYRIAWVDPRRAREHDASSFETSTESFDRLAFAERVLAMLRPPKTRVAVCPGDAGVRVESGRRWGGGSDEKWAMLVVPPLASRRAITLAAVELSGGRVEPYVLDVLLGPPHA
jgi:hypothetical protein